MLEYAYNSCADGIETGESLDLAGQPVKVNKWASDWSDILCHQKQVKKRHDIDLWPLCVCVQTVEKTLTHTHIQKNISSKIII